MGKKTGANPTDRAKKGTKRSLLVDGNGIPVALAVDGANRHDQKLVQATFENMAAHRPLPGDDEPQNICLDKGYDSVRVEALLLEWGFVPHIQARGQEATAKREIPGYRARRWVVERSHSWMNRFRRLLIRWEKKVANYEALLHLACAFITFRRAGLFG